MEFDSARRPANRQGRIAADVIMDVNQVFRGVQGTIGMQSFNTVVSCTPVSVKKLYALKLMVKKFHMKKFISIPEVTRAIIRSKDNYHETDLWPKDAGFSECSHW